MKKQVIVDLIRYHVDGNESGFRSQAYDIANEFEQMGDHEIARFIRFQLSGDSWVPQDSCEIDLPGFWQKSTPSDQPLPLPEIIVEDVMGIVNAVAEKRGVNKFLFIGSPGTGKTETAKQIARLLSRDLFILDFTQLIDSHLGETARNISEAFRTMSEGTIAEHSVFFLDELDAIAMDRTNSRDVREMGRVTSAFLKQLDSLDSRIVVIAATNLHKHMDKAIIRRFDAVVDFNRYEKEDLLMVADSLMKHYCAQFKRKQPAKRLYHKVLLLLDSLPYPGDLKNYIKSSLVFSSSDEADSCIRRLYRSVLNGRALTAEELHHRGFTVREIQTLTGVSKSKVARDLRS